MQDHQKQGVPLPPGASEQMDYIRVVERRRMEAATLRQKQQQQQQLQRQQQQLQSGVGRVATTASFRDVVEAFAEASGIMFLPKPGRQHEGKQVRVVCLFFPLGGGQEWFAFLLRSGWAAITSVERDPKSRA